MGGVAVGEHRAPVHRPQHPQELLALVSIPHSLVLPQDVALELTILLDNVIAGSRVLGQTLGEVRLRPGSDGAAGGCVGVGEEAAGAGVPAVAPVVAPVLLNPAQLLAGGGRLLYWSLKRTFAKFRAFSLLKFATLRLSH